jgi:NADH-quinone oxidoreductase subunit K
VKQVAFTAVSGKEKPNTVIVPFERGVATPPWPTWRGGDRHRSATLRGVDGEIAKVESPSGAGFHGPPGHHQAGGAGARRSVPAGVRGGLGGLAALVGAPLARKEVREDLHHPLQHMLLLSAIIFCCGVYTILTRKNAVSILMGVELVLNAANINFVSFSQYTRIGGVHGNIFTIFVILLAAAEAAVALAIIIGMYQNFGKVDVDQADNMKE